MANWPALLCIVVLGAALTPTGFAQWAASIADPSLPLFPAELVESMSSRLGLNDTQQREIDVAHERFRVEHLRLYELRKKLSAENFALGEQEMAQVENGQEIPESINNRRNEIFRMNLALADQVEMLREHTRAEIKSFLTADQSEEWERLLRDSRRQLTLGRSSSLIGEGVDLIQCLDDLEISSPALLLIRERYMDELDPLLIRRNKTQVENLRKVYQGMLGRRTGQGDTRALAIYESFRTPEDKERVERELAELGAIKRRERLDRMRPGYRAALPLRRHNLRYLDQFNQLLSPLDQQRLKELYQRLAFSYYPNLSPT